MCKHSSEASDKLKPSTGVTEADGKRSRSTWSLCEQSAFHMLAGHKQILTAAHFAVLITRLFLV